MNFEAKSYSGYFILDGVFSKLASNKFFYFYFYEWRIRDGSIFEQIINPDFKKGLKFDFLWGRWKSLSTRNAVTLVKTDISTYFKGKSSDDYNQIDFLFSC